MSIIFTEDNFEKEVIKSGLPALVDFFGTWCPPCKLLAPIIEELAEELPGKVKVGKLDIDQAQEIAAKYNVMSAPTMILFKNGREEKRIVGLRSKADILKEIENYV